MFDSRSPLSLKFWLAVCTALNFAGWTLSALGHLGRAGYAAGAALFAGVCWLLFARAPAARRFLPRRRFRRALPAAWLALAALAVLGGLLHAPSHYDALAYRVPRVLHWLAEGHWHWIHTDFHRLNPRAVGYEWLMAPLIAFQHTERWTWVFNGAGYLLMPGLVFSVFTRLGIAPRAAWRWMWVLPAGYGYVLQAAGLGNDMIGGVYALAAMHFALRARDRRSWRDFAGALIAAGLATGVKTSNLTLLLPVGAALLPCWRLALQRPLAIAAAAFVGVVSSFLPMAVLNWWHCGDWKGARYEVASALTVTPLVGFVGNSVALAAQNLNPPILPRARELSRFVPLVIPEPLRSKALVQFEEGIFTLSELEDEGDNLGFGATLLVLWAACCGLRGAFGGSWLRWAPWGSLLVYMLTCGIGTAARIIIPYYALLIPALVASAGAQRLVRGRAWHRAALASLALAMLVVVLTPSRPLWPAQTVSAWLLRQSPGSALALRMHTVYSVYAKRPDVFEPIRSALPAGETVFGLVTSDDPETSLWRPFGRRRFCHVTRDDSLENLRARGIRTVVVNAADFEARMHRPLAQWLREMNAGVTATFTLRTRAAQPPWDWHIVRLRDGEVGKPAPMP